MNPRLLTKQHLEFLSLTGGCTGSSESTLVKMPHCWKSHVMANYMVSTQDLHGYLSYWKAVMAVVRLCQCIHKVGKVERSGSVGRALDRGLKGC